jgi:hypothetical protein
LGEIPPSTTFGADLPCSSADANIAPDSESNRDEIVLSNAVDVADADKVPKRHKNSVGHNERFADPDKIPECHANGQRYSIAHAVHVADADEVPERDANGQRHSIPHAVHVTDTEQNPDADEVSEHHPDGQWHPFSHAVYFADAEQESKLDEIDHGDSYFNTEQNADAVAKPELVSDTDTVTVDVPDSDTEPNPVADALSAGDEVAVHNEEPVCLADPELHADTLCHSHADADSFAVQYTVLDAEPDTITGSHAIADAHPYPDA